MAGEAEIRALLSTTSVPDEVVDDVLRSGATVWLMSERADVLALDVALCHPRLRSGEVRVAARPTSAPFTWRLTVVAPDRAGLLADLAAALALDGLAVHRSSGTTWDGGRLALLSLRVSDPASRRLADADWDEIGGRLREAARGAPGRDVPHVAPWPPVRVRTTPQPGSRTLVTVLAPDSVGLLWAVASWFTAQAANIEAAHVHTDGGDAYGTFLVSGAIDPAALMTHLSGRPAAPSLVQSLANLATSPLRRLRSGS